MEFLDVLNFSISIGFYILGIIAVGKKASEYNRSVPLYVVLSIFIGWLIPFIVLCVKKEKRADYMATESTTENVNPINSNVIQEKPEINLKEGYKAIVKDGRLFAITEQNPDYYCYAKCYHMVSSETSSMCSNCGSSLMYN